MPAHRPKPMAGDGLVRLGAAVFAVGLVAIAVMFVPFVLDAARNGARHAQETHEYGVALNLAAFLTCVGFGCGLVGLLRQARQSRQRSRADG